MSIDFAEWKKGNREKWKIMDEVFPKIKKLLQGGRVVQFSIENNHPVMRTFESKGNDMPIKTIDGSRAALARKENMEKIENVAQRRSEPLGKYNCKFLWPDGDGFIVVMNELPKEVYMDSLGDRIFFVQSDQDETVYLYAREERLQ